MCIYCESFRGFYCFNTKEFEDNIIKIIFPNYNSFKDHEIYQENYLAIFQFIFDLTFEEDGLFILNNVLICK